MAMEIETGRILNPSDVSIRSVSLSEWTRQFDSLDGSLRAERKKIFRATLGKTKRSVFLWGFGSERLDRDFVRFAQWMHQRFWTSSDTEGWPILVDGWLSDSLYGDLAATALAAYGVDVGDDHGAAADLLAQPLKSQLRHVELPLWQSIGADAVGEPVSLLVQQMEQLIVECLDTDGWPESRMVTDTAALTASWCRCCELFKHLGQKIDPDVYFMLCELNQQLVRLSRRDGSLLFGEVDGGLNGNAFKKAMRRNFTTSFLERLKKKSARTRREPSVSSISEWGQVGVLQSSWKTGSHKVGLAFGDRTMQIDISNGHSLVGGDCTPELKLDSVSQAICSEIGVSGFLRFEECDYLELEFEFETAKVQRQLLFFGKDKLLFLNDVVQTTRPAEIEYRAAFELAKGIKIVRETENNEFYLTRGSEYNLVLPLALPEWKTQRCESRLEFSDNRFVVDRVSSGIGFSLPLVFDLDPKRSQRPRTWRRLTVAESMRIVGDDQAVAFRVQIDRDQWLFYRSVGEKGNRTFLGQNYADEFFVGKIDREGNIKTLIEIE